MPVQATLKVTSDVRRDLLASAAIFKNEAAVVWEYVVNSLQYVERGTAPRVLVSVRPRAREIVISDNGRGMSAEELEHYFRMHGENVDRLRGRPGRGKFGTGKSAAFGIARAFGVDTRRDGLRNVVVLTREMIDRSDGDGIPLGWKVRNEVVATPNGTVVTISDIIVPRIKTPTIIEYIERHLQAFRAVGPEVAVNDHVCEYREPTVAEVATYRPTAAQATVIGDVALTIKIAQAPLPDSDQGITVTAGVGNLVAIERAGLERKEYGNYLFGEIDVPNLELFESALEPYDSTRSLALNPSHPVAGKLIPFIGSKLEEVRLGLVTREREARKNEQARRLAKEADKIAEILNKDFEAVRHRLSEIRSASSAAGSASSNYGGTLRGGEEPTEWVEGLQHPGEVNESEGQRQGSGGRGRKAPQIASSGDPRTDGASSVDAVGGTDGNRRRPRGGFRVDFRNMGRDEPRSVYDETSIAILINLDHPVVAAALGDGGAEDSVFRRLSYEIAFSEYAIALAYETAKQDPDIPADDVIFDVRTSLNRISVAAAALYR